MPVFLLYCPFQTLMKDLFFLSLKSSMGAKMRKGFRNICNNDNSTSTLNQHNTLYAHEPFASSSQAPSSSSYIENEHNVLNAPPRKSVTLEEMILQLELEEEKARKEKEVNHRYKEEEEIRANKFHHRMSCVNNSDILRSARNALNQYPRFSLDGRDSMYRSNFRNNLFPSIDGLKLGRILHLPQSIGGESVIWCKPGVVPKLMGLEAMPMPLSKLNKTTNSNKNRYESEKLSIAMRNQNLRRRAQRSELERRQRKHAMDSHVSCGNVRRSSRSGGGNGSGSNSCTSNGYYVMNPIAMEPVLGLGGPISWPTHYDHT